MSKDYIISIRRKKDDKEIAQFICNHIKGLIDSHIMPSDKWCEGSKFDYNDLSDVMTIIKDKISLQYKEIQEKRLSAALAKTIAVKEAHENDIRYIEDEVIPEYFDCYYSAAAIQGSVETLTENNICIEDSVDNNDDSDDADDEEYTDRDVAYRYNAEGLESDRKHPCLWVSDVYCMVI